MPRPSAHPLLAAPGQVLVRLRRVPGVVWVLGLLAAAVAVALSLSVFAHGSIDNDDAVYLLQARTLAGGHLTVQMGANPESTQPWFFAITPHGYVPKYLPVVALLYAVGLVLFGSVVPITAVLAFLLPVAVWGLARTAGLERRRAIAAVAVVALSPAVLVQGGLVLSYLPFLLLLVVAWTLLLHVWRTTNPWAAGAFGLVAAVAACFRPLDPVLLLGPAVLWVLWRLRRRAVRPAVFAVAAAVPVAVLVAVYDLHTTGRALHLPFNLLSPNDSLGYGVRQLVPEDPPFRFGPIQGLYGGWLEFLRLPLGWMLGFAVVLPLAGWNLRRGGAASPQVRLIASAAAVFTVAYLGFWGPWNTTVLWGGPGTIGPFYALPLLPPLALAAASWWPTGRGRALQLVAALAVAGLVLNGLTVATAVDRNGSAARRTTTVLAVARNAPGTLIYDADPPYLMHPVGALGDQLPGHGRPILLASQLDAAQITTVADPTLLQLAGGVYGGYLAYRLTRQVRTSGPALSLVVSQTAVRTTETSTTTLVVSHAGHEQACAFTGATALTVTATDVTGCADAAVTAAVAAKIAKLPYRLCASADCLSFSLFATDAKGHVTATGWRRVPLAVAGGRLTALTDGVPLLEYGTGWITVAGL